MVSLLVFAYLLRKRFLLPLDNLSRFMIMLGEREYKTVSLEDVDVILLPLFTNYNQMVDRLVELEQEHKSRQQILEQKIGEAARILLEQHLTLARAERLAVVGEFAATLAHELRNPIAGIQMALTNLSSEIPDQDYQRRIQVVNDELSRVSNILNYVLDQSKHAPEQSVEFEANTLIESVTHFLKYQLPPQISLRLKGGGNCCLPADSLRQAIINIIINAAQAIGDQPGEIEIDIQKSSDRIKITICDNGPGFPQQMLNRPMQPFNTWKEKGTGLGLAMVRRFVRNVSGELQLENRAQGGACVLLNLPCYQGG
jgi:signal transduction histidine kinase